MNWNLKTPSVSDRNQPNPVEESQETAWKLKKAEEERQKQKEAKQKTVRKKGLRNGSSIVRGKVNDATTRLHHNLLLFSFLGLHDLVPPISHSHRLAIKHVIGLLLVVYISSSQSALILGFVDFLHPILIPEHIHFHPLLFSILLLSLVPFKFPPEIY